MTEHRRRVLILGTGGTIAGAQRSPGARAYDPGQLHVDELLASVPALLGAADIQGEQFMNVASQDMTESTWLALADRVQARAAAPDVDGVVITHGTDTLEETAYFLNLVLKTAKPVVLVGSMRPADAMSPDGPANLYNAVVVAADPGAAGRGVLAVVNDEIHAARDVVKTCTMRVDAFQSPNRGPLGLVVSGEITWFAPSEKRHTTRSEFSVEPGTQLPRVDILYGYASMSPDLVDAAIEHGARGLVVAGVGHGNVARGSLAKLVEARERGVVIVRSSRLERGIVLRNGEVDDDGLGFVASHEHNPQKARVLLQLGLTRTDDPLRIQEMFGEY
jgi:L-asparaginase